MSNRSITESASYKSTPSIKYNDLYFRLVACMIGAHILVAYGETLSIFEMLLMPYYYYALIPSFAIAFVLFNIIRAITILLDKKFDWSQHTIQRAASQSFFGFIIPSLCAFILAFGYFVIRGVNIFQTTYLRYDFQFILLQLLMINLYYVAYYFYQKWSHAEKTISLLTLTHNYRLPVTKQTFQVSKGAANLSLDIDTIAYFYREADSNYLRTVNGEDYFLNAALDEVQLQLPENTFFRTNRQLIIHRQACKAYDLLTYGKLAVTLEPSLPIEAIVSQKRAKEFKKWIDIDP